MDNSDPRRHSAAAERNRGPILEILKRVLPPQGRALEIAAGTGQHAVHFAVGLPGWTWQPSDPDPSALTSMSAWSADAGLARLKPPVELDVLSEPWPVTGPYDAIFCANMLHISPWSTCAALMRGAASLLSTEGLLLTYGPYFEQGVEPSPGNAAFDADLRARNPAWGLRFVHEVAERAQSEGLVLAERHAMPANNLTLVFRRA